MSLCVVGLSSPGRPPKFQSAPNSPQNTSPLSNGMDGYSENGRQKKFKYKRVVTADSPVDDVSDKIMHAN